MGLGRAEPPQATGPSSGWIEYFARVIGIDMKTAPMFDV